MGTTASFQTMLNEYLPNKLLKEELIKRDWLLQNMEIDESWKGGKLIVPFKSAGASSIRMGALTASNDIAQDAFVRGYISDYVEAWGSMIFNHRDLMDHSGRVVEDSFLKILPDMVDDFISAMKETVSIQIGTGAVLATATDDTNRATGVFVVDHVDRFVLGQKVTIDDNDSPALSVYVIAIDLNTSSVTFSATRGGLFVDLSAYTVAQAAKFYTDDANTTSFQSLRSALLSAANGGSANLHNVSKLSAPYLQAINIDGTAITAANILESIFDAYTTVRRKARGNAKTVLMSYKNLGSCMKALTLSAGAGYQGQFSASAGAKKASVYGWDEIEVTSVKGTLKLVGIQEWDDDIIALLDMSSFVFRTGGMFKKRKAPDGKEYFEVRNTTGYQYILDICCFGELEVTKPGANGIIHTVAY